MSRSFAHKPKFSWVCYFSNKKDKQLSSKKRRRQNRRQLSHFKNMKYYDFMESESVDEVFLLSKNREVEDNWNFASDGLPCWHGIPDITQKIWGSDETWYRWCTYLWKMK